MPAVPRPFVARLIRPRATSTHFYSSAPSPLSRPPPAPPPPSRTGLKVLGAFLLAGTGVAIWDRLENAQALRRTLRTAVFGVKMAFDFKWNFTPEDPESVEELHERAAARIYQLCTTNGGLYIKLAQSIAVQAAILPAPYRRVFANIFDGAPAVPWDDVVTVFRGEFGVHPDDAFDEFSREAAASASIAQVHKARLKRSEGEPPWKDDEGWVAVKVRKPYVPKQIEWDLLSYRTLLWANEWLFDIPVSFIASYVSEQMRKEVDLLNEAQNATKTAELLATEPKLRNRVVVPRVEWKWTGASVMTAEYITATKLTDKDGLNAQGLSFKKTMDAATDLFAAMVFKWGWLHCDPHPGNVLVRRHPDDPKRPQIVLIDHGLYIPLSEDFRLSYCLLWRSLFVVDIPAIEKIAQKWGIPKEHSEMFASMTLLRPQHLRKKEQRTAGQKKESSAYEAQVGLKERLKAMLQNEQLIPRELIFLTRTLRMMQANNQALGSPTNRINAMAHWAVDGLKQSSTIKSLSVQERKRIGITTLAWEKVQLVIFRITVLVVDLGFLLSQVRQWVLERLGTVTGEGFEDVLQRQVTEMAKSEFGVDLDESAFTG